MYALVTRLRFKSNRGPSMEAAELERQAALTVQQTGFRALVVVRIASTEAVVVRVYDNRASLGVALNQGWSPELGEEFAAKPERVEGEVLFSVWAAHPGQISTAKR